MSVTTEQALPYPLPTDPVMQGADNIRALAETLDPRVPARIHSGVQTLAGNGASGQMIITLPSGKFTQPPVVQLTVQQGGATFMPFVVTITTVQFSIVARHYQNVVGAFSLPIHWLAIQQAP